MESREMDYFSDTSSDSEEEKVTMIDRWLSLHWLWLF